MQLHNLGRVIFKATPTSVFLRPQNDDMSGFSACGLQGFGHCAQQIFSTYQLTLTFLQKHSRLFINTLCFDAMVTVLFSSSWLCSMC